MALFSSNLKKMRNELENERVDWEKMASLSGGRYDLSGKNSAEGKELVSLLIRRASECTAENPFLAMIIRNVSSRGGDFNRSMNETGATPVHMAAAVENGLLLSALLEAGVPAVAVTHSGATALHKAAAAGCLGNVRLLLAAGADPGAEDSMSNSPLHVAAQTNHSTEIVKALLQAGAKAYQRNSSGKRPVDYAGEKGCQVCASILKESLLDLRRNRKTGWSCPGCGTEIKRPSPEKVDWYLSIDMWEHLRFTCGNCGRVTPALQLDGEV